jgi:hypothetical protein
LGFVANAEEEDVDDEAAGVGRELEADLMTLWLQTTL